MKEMSNGLLRAMAWMEVLTFVRFARNSGPRLGKSSTAAYDPKRTLRRGIINRV
jgi:hypothetical protein